jgi:hypothetical protein
MLFVLSGMRDTNVNKFRFNSQFLNVTASGTCGSYYGLTVKSPVITMCTPAVTLNSSAFCKYSARKLKVFENRVLSRIFGPKRDEVTGEWRRLHKEEFNDLYSPPNIIRMIKSRRMR